jgi:hypothetical protein
MKSLRDSSWCWAKLRTRSRTTLISVMVCSGRCGTRELQREVVVLVAAHTARGSTTAPHTTTGSRRPIAKWAETAIEVVFVADVGWRSRCSSRRPTGTRSGACS